MERSRSVPIISFLSLQMTSVDLRKCTPTTQRTTCTLIRHTLTAVHRHPQPQLPMASALTSALRTQTLGERIFVRKRTRMEDSGGMRPLPHHHLPPVAWSLFVCCTFSTFPCLSLSADLRSKRLVMFPVFCKVCLRAQLGICREAVCVSHLPIAGRQAGRWVLGPPCGAGLHRLSGHR